jgi:hypothetical protein
MPLSDRFSRGGAFGLRHTDYRIRVLGVGKTLGVSKNKEDMMNLYRTVTAIVVFVALFLGIAGCTPTAVLKPQIA